MGETMASRIDKPTEQVAEGGSARSASGPRLAGAGPREAHLDLVLWAAGRLPCWTHAVGRRRPRSILGGGLRARSFRLVFVRDVSESSRRLLPGRRLKRPARGRPSSGLWGVWAGGSAALGRAAKRPGCPSGCGQVGALPFAERSGHSCPRGVGTGSLSRGAAEAVPTYRQPRHCPQASPPGAGTGICALRNLAVSPVRVRRWRRCIPPCTASVPFFCLVVRKHGLDFKAQLPRSNSSKCFLRSRMGFANRLLGKLRRNSQRGSEKSPVVVKTILLARA